MNLDQAMNVVENVCAKAMGNLEDHKLIQQAIQEIKKALAPETVKTE